MLIYSLSNRQRKELDRGGRLKLAIPIDPDWPGPVDSVTAGLVWQWVLERLPEITARSIESVLRADVWVDAWHADEQVAGSPTAQWGVIVDEDKIATQDVIRIRCVVVSVSDVDHPKTTYPVRWPGGKIESSFQWLKQ